MSDIQSYLDSKLRNLFEEVVTSCLLEKPKNVEMFLLNFFKVKNGDLLTGAEKQELVNLRNQIDRANKGHQSNSNSDESEEDDEIEDLPISLPKKQQGRTSVSAEAFGNWNQKQAYIPKIIPKSSEVKSQLQDRLKKSFMFANLEEQERLIVLNAMEEKKFSSGDMVITQGDDGNELYFVESGKLECFKVFPGESTPKVLKIYESGEAFGELALLYNTPRAASIKALSPSVCWVLDRECFNNIVKEAAIKKRERYDQFLSKVGLLKSMEPYERSQLSDCLNPIEYQPNETVIREGEWGECFYIIEQGTAKATKVLNPGCPPEDVKSYLPGDYFGELALIKGEPRAANIIATSHLKCVTLDRMSFKRLLGPVEEILKRDAEQYSKYSKVAETKN
jgi:cAMP-dependent protein kinase regulator